jgi:hypothetical protein
MILPRFFHALVAVSLLNPSLAASATSGWVHLDDSMGDHGKLVYQTTPAGDRIMDFSSAGYGGGGVPLPEPEVKETVKPSGSGDDSATIQAAIDRVAALPLKNGFRGTVLLARGTFTCAKTLSLSTSGIVLRGSGSGIEGTTIKMVGAKHVAFALGRASRRDSASKDDDENSRDSSGSAPRDLGPVLSEITDAYWPAGTTNITASDTSHLAVGDLLSIRRPTTVAWVKRMEMDTLKRDGRAQTWIGENRSEIVERTITAISENRITLDLPLPDSYDASVLNPPGVTVRKVKPTQTITNLGLEHVHLQCPPLEIMFAQAPYSAVRVDADDCWVNDVFCEETMNSTTLAGKRITVQQVVIAHTFPNLGAAKPSDFSIEGSQILIDRCKVTGDNEYFVWTTDLRMGPNVVLNSTFNGRGSRIQPHQRWSTGLLIDNCRVPDGGIDFMNRGVAGSGHGWTMGWAVAWNCIAKTYVVQNPPGATNWAIGCIGERVQTPRLFDSMPILADGTFDSHGIPVEPRSLYLAQLAERLGLQALSAIGYSKKAYAALGSEPVTPLPPFPTDVDPVLGPDLAIHRPVDTSELRGHSPEFGGEKALDANPKTYWATDDDSRQVTFIADLEGPLEINAIVIEEASDHQGQVQAYKVEGQVDSDWKLLSEGTIIGEHKVDRFPRTTAWKVRLTILKANPYAAIRKFGLYLSK